MKGAARLPEFIIRVPHPDPTHATKINFYLNVKWVPLPVQPRLELYKTVVSCRFPKTYPTLACPTFTIQKPIEGLNNEQVTKLSHAIVSEAQKCRGSEMVFQVRQVIPPIVSASAEH